MNSPTCWCRYQERVEIGVKAFWQEDVVFTEILDENPDIRESRDAIRKRLTEKTHGERLCLGQAIEQIPVRKRLAAEQLILDYLKPFAHKTKLNKTFGDQMILNAAFLVEQRLTPDMD